MLRVAGVVWELVRESLIMECWVPQRIVTRFKRRKEIAFVGCGGFGGGVRFWGWRQTVEAER